MGWISSLLGIGVPFIIGLACFAASVFVYFYVGALMPTVARGLAVVLVVIGALAIGYGRGFEVARDACGEASLRVELQKSQMDLAAAKRAHEIAENSIAELNAADVRNQEIVHEIERIRIPAPEPHPVPERIPERIPEAAPYVQPPAPPRDACQRLSPGDVGRLLRIRP